MKTTGKLALALAAVTLAVAGCGGDDSGSEEDTAAINGVVEQINLANSEKDGAAYCALLQPSSFFDTFTSRAKCASETEKLLSSVDAQPDLVVDSVAIDGDTAAVSFEGRSGEAPFVKEDGKWYLVLNQQVAEPSESDSSGSGSQSGGNGDGG